MVYSHVNFCTPHEAEKFPKMQNTTPYQTTVREGDVLYLPCGWWHAVRGGVGRNMSINYWFALHPRKQDCPSPMQKNTIDNQVEKTIATCYFDKLCVLGREVLTKSQPDFILQR